MSSSSNELNWLSLGSSSDVVESLMMEPDVELSTLSLFKGVLFGVIADLVAPSPCLVLSVGLRLFVADIEVFIRGFIV